MKKAPTHVPRYEQFDEAFLHYLAHLLQGVDVA